VAGGAGGLRASLTSEPPAWRHGRGFVLALSLLALFQTLHAARVQAWTYDEPFHLAWTERLWATGEWERTSTARFNSRTPIVLANVLAKRAAAAAGVPDAEKLRFAARLPSALWLAGALALVWLFSRHFFDERTAVLATSACALDPNLVAHASLATVDAAYTCATLAVLAAAALVFAQPGARRGGLLGAALGLAFVAKFSAVLLVPALLVAALLDARVRSTSARTLLTGALAGAVAAWVVVCGGYLFRGIGVPVGSLSWASAPFAALAEACPALRLPLPAAALTGLDASLADERKAWASAILGQVHYGGTWYYFAFLWLLKTPLLVLAATAWGLGRATRLLSTDPALRLLAVHLVVGLVYFSLFFQAQIGYRFVLMLVPLAYTIAARGLGDLDWSRRTTVLAAAVCAVALGENLFYLGNPLAFTNAAVQPKRLVYRLTADSNLDWGQNRERISPHLARVGAAHTQLDPHHILPGHNTLEVNALAGVFGEERHRWVRENLRPSGHFLHTYVWYEIDNGTYVRFLREARSLASASFAAASCPASAALPHHDAGSRVPLAFTGLPGPNDGWQVCVVVRKELDFGVRVQKGRLRFGRVRADGSCDAALLDTRQVAWYRLQPGTHALCALAVPNRRAFLPYTVEADWIVRGAGAELGVVPHVFAPGPPALQNVSE
jgi:4-amino-4-deoxy-L-arabinose transferase-like glycosyltransferase